MCPHNAARTSLTRRWQEMRLGKGTELPPPPPPRTKWTRRVPHPVLIGHAASIWGGRGGKGEEEEDRKTTSSPCASTSGGGDLEPMADYCAGVARARNPRFPGVGAHHSFGFPSKRKSSSTPYTLSPGRAIPGQIRESRKAGNQDAGWSRRYGRGMRRGKGWSGGGIG
jgi:hypothetical protein